MNISDYSVQSFEDVWDIVESYFNYPECDHPAIEDIIDINFFS